MALIEHGLSECTVTLAGRGEVDIKDLVELGSGGIEIELRHEPIVLLKIIAE